MQQQTSTRLPVEMEENLDAIINQFKAVYMDQRPNDLKVQIPFLAELAKYYGKLAEAEPRSWTHPLRAHALFNSCAVRDTETPLQWKMKAYRVEKMYFGDGYPLSFEEQQQCNLVLTRALEEIRQTIRTELLSLLEIVQAMDVSDLNSEQNMRSELEFTNRVRSLSKLCTQQMQNFIELIFKNSIKLVGQPPCPLAVLGLGSMARGEITPYSDIEYLFLVGKSEHQQYFERLAMASYFLIGNLEETNLKCMSIPELSEKKWFEDTARTALRIDGIGGKAGNIPTGNEIGSKYLIRTPEELAEDFQRMFCNPSTESSETVGDLSDMLQSTRLVFDHDGGQTLYEEFVQRKRLVQEPLSRRSVSLDNLQKDLNAFSFFPTNISPTNRLLDVKTDLYRFPTILYEDLKIVFMLDTSDCWDTVDQLVQEYQLSDETKSSLMFLLAISMYTRLDAYSFYNCQKDEAAVLEGSARNVYHFKSKLLRRYCSLLFTTNDNFVSLTKAVLVKRDHQQGLSIQWPTVDNSHFIRRDVDIGQALMHAFSMEWNATLQHLQTTILDVHSVDDMVKMDRTTQERYTRAVNLAGVCAYYSQERPEEAFKYSSILVQVMEALHGVDDRNNDLANSYNNIGTCLHSLGRYQDALSYHKRAMKIYETLYEADGTNNHLASSYNNIGSCLHSLGRYQDALSYCERAMKIEEALYGVDDTNNDLAISYNNIGNCLRSLERYQDALSHFKRATKIKEALDGVDGINHYLASSYSNIGSCLCSLGRYQDALPYSVRAAKIREALQGFLLQTKT